MPSPYEIDNNPMMHRGAIYEFRPVFWLRPPLWILRNLKVSTPGRADVYRWDELAGAFRSFEEEHEEDVVARAKIRYVVILSNNRETQNQAFKSVLVAPLYTLKVEKLSEAKLKFIRSNSYPNLYYLPTDSSFPASRERYIDFRRIQLLDKQFLREGKVNFTLTHAVTKSILQSYKKYLSEE
jgi:hypothetical protein